MDDLPELPFEQVLSYLNLEDRLKARAVSRAWRNKFDRYPVMSLCYSQLPIGRILEKSRWVSGAFAQNFISSTRFTSFFDTFGQTILSSLKHLRLCDLELNGRNGPTFTYTLNSFGQLEELDIVRVRCGLEREFKLNLPMLTRIHLEKVILIARLVLEAPRLREVKILGRLGYRTCSRVEIVHGESVERLLVDRWEYTEVKNLKNLQYLYFDCLLEEDPTFLSNLKHLKEIHTNEADDVSELFEQKRLTGLVDLKIYLCGLLLNGPDDPAIDSLNRLLFSSLCPEAFNCLAENQSRRADLIPFFRDLFYFEIEGVAPRLEVDLLKRFTDWREIKVYEPVRDIPGFLDLLKNCENIVEFDGDQPQDLFDRLPEHCAIQKLFIGHPPTDLAFLFRLKHLIVLDLRKSIDIETVRRAFDELPSLFSFKFLYLSNLVKIEIYYPKRFWVSVDDCKEKIVFDLNAAFQFVVEDQL